MARYRVLLCWLLAPGTTTAQQPSSSMQRAEGLYRAGAAAYLKNDLETALGDFRQVVHLEPSSSAGHSSLGVVLSKMGHVRESVPELEEALKLKFADNRAQVSLAAAYEQLGEPEKELGLLERIEASNRSQHRPLPADLSVMYARALVAQHRLAQAITRMKMAIDAEPHNAALLDNLGSLYAMGADWPNAEQSFRAAISAEPTLAAAHLHLGLSLRAQGRAGVVDELSTAYHLQPDNPVANLELGRALAAEGHDQEAIPLLERANRTAPQGSDAAYQLALTLQRAGRFTEAIPLFEKATTAQPDNAEILTNYGLALCQQQKAAQAVPILQKAVALAPQDPTALENLAAAYLQLNRIQDAIAQLRAAIPLRPDSPQLHYNLGLAFKMQDDPADAIPELEKAESLDPEQSESKYALGMLYMQSGRYDDAARELSRSLTMQPNNGDGWATLGSVYNKLNRLPDAENALRQAIARLPEQPDPHLTLAGVLVKEGKPEDAIAERRLAANLMRSNMNRQRAEVATHTGDALLQRGDLEGARVQFQDALSFDSTFKEAHQGLARIFDALGRPADAAEERAKSMHAKE